MDSKGKLNPKDRRLIGIQEKDRAVHSHYVRELQVREPECPEAAYDQPTVASAGRPGTFEACSDSHNRL